MASLVILLLWGCGNQKANQDTALELADEQIDNIVRYSYQYVAMYNVIQKIALDGNSGGLFTDGFNKPKANTKLTDHTAKAIARQNNDTFYQAVVLDLRNDAVIIEFPVIDSKYAVLETSGYAHYAGIPLASSNGDFKQPTKLLFYTERTDGYQGQAIEGVDRIVKSDDDYMVAFLRAMPHQFDPERMAKIKQALKNVKVITLSEFQGETGKSSDDANFPAYGKTDGDVFADNLLEVMQFIFNHTTFDPNDEIDQALLALYKPLGVEPGKVFDTSHVAKLDGPMFRTVADKVAKGMLASMADPVVQARMLPKVFLPEGQADLETLVLQSAIGPIGLPADQNMSIPIATIDGNLMNAKNDYVLRMSKDELPPAKAFWSVTLYDLKNGFFIPNDHKKYSVGENAGLKLNADGGIEIYISANKPKDVPKENWLPINREDLAIDAMFRIYAPDAEKMKTWKTPQLEMLPDAK